MKKIGIIIGAVFFFVLFLGIQAFANFTGSFHIDPKVMHKKAIHGQMTLLMEEATLTSVHLESDEPVFGKTAFDSKEQAIRFYQSGALDQMTCVFQLNGPKHKWYFVVVSNFQTDDTGTSSYKGAIYKVAASIEDILKFVENGVDAVPAEWKKVGNTDLAQ